MDTSTDIPTAPVSPIPPEHASLPTGTGVISAIVETSSHATSRPSSRRQIRVSILPTSYDEYGSTASRTPSTSRRDSSLTSAQLTSGPATQGSTKARARPGSSERRQSRATEGPARGPASSSPGRRHSSRNSATTRSFGSDVAPLAKSASELTHIASLTHLSFSQREGAQSTPVAGARKGKRSSSRSPGKTTPVSRTGRRETTLKKGSRRLSTPQRRSPNTGKKTWKKLLQVVINAEMKSRAGIYTEYEAEWKEMVVEFSIDSFEPQRRNILQLQGELYRVRRECEIATTRAEDALERLIKCTSHFLQMVRATGADFLNEHQILEADVPHATPTITTEEEILSCARDPPSYMTESHVPAKRKDSEQVEEIARISSFFLELMQELDAGGPPSEKYIGLAVERADELAKNTTLLTSSFSSLIQRVRRMLEQRQQKVEVMQGAINEQATRVKVADDFLRETTAKHRVEVDSAIQLCREFGMELRQRMDALEKGVLDSLADLIQRSTEVSIENNAFHDHAQLLLNKETTIQRYMSKMETVSVEQGKLLRDVRLRLLQLWKERCGEGDEERSTLTHSGLPKRYHTALDACDRDTLLRLLHFVSLNSDGVPALLINALDEHELFIKGNTEEARAVAEQSATEAAVRALLEKLYEEGDIKANPRYCSTSLADTINDMVRHYNTYMTTVEKEERRATRKKLLETFSSPYPFFDSRTPVPEEYAAEIASRPAVQKKRPALCDGNASRMQPDITTQTSPGGAATLPSINPNAKDENFKMAPTQIEACHVVGHLRQSHPSALDPPGTATVVGFGRWGGKLAQRGAERRAHSTGGGNSDGTNGPSAHDGADIFRCQVGYRPNPPPRVPPRMSIMRHVLEHHCHDVGTLTTAPQLHCKCFPGEDAPFLKRQRVLFEADLPP